MYNILNKDKQVMNYKNVEYTLKKGKNEINASVDNIEFSLGDYALEVRLNDTVHSSVKVVQKGFSSKLFGFPATIRDLDLAIKQMQYYAAPSDIDEIAETADYEERLRKFIDFWKAQDPSPNTVENETVNEYYRRVEYANEHFKGYFNGWRSDMGMVYITLGAPDQVTRRPYEMDSKPYEIWDYYIINRRFVFVDQTNFGDYRLLNPAYGDWFRYRP
jgi:GWxTD domain-containing protein